MYDQQRLIRAKSVREMSRANLLLALMRVAALFQNLTRRPISLCIGLVGILDWLSSPYDIASAGSLTAYCYLWGAMGCAVTDRPGVWRWAHPKLTGRFESRGDG